MGLISAYELLGVSEEATDEEIRIAFHQRAMRFHPDRGGKLEYFLRIQESYAILSHKDLRERLGSKKQFQKLPLRLQPSLSRAATTLFENLAVLEDELQKITKLPKEGENMKWESLFDWVLSQKLKDSKTVTISDRHGENPVYPLQRTNIENIHLGYNEQGQLSLADVKPTGFLLSVRA